MLKRKHRVQTKPNEENEGIIALLCAYEYTRAYSNEYLYMNTYRLGFNYDLTLYYLLVCVCYNGLLLAMSHSYQLPASQSRRLTSFGDSSLPQLQDDNNFRIPIIVIILREVKVCYDCEKCYDCRTIPMGELPGLQYI